MNRLERRILEIRRSGWERFCVQYRTITIKCFYLHDSFWISVNGGALPDGAIVPPRVPIGLHEVIRGGGEVTDCSQCRHKLLCLLDKKANQTFEAKV